VWPGGDIALIDVFGYDEIVWELDVVEAWSKAFSTLLLFPLCIIYLVEAMAGVQLCRSFSCVDVLKSGVSTLS
jgi:hypothetical protein